MDSLINEVKTGYGGLTYSQTAGTMTLITNILDGLNASLGISIDKQGQMIVNSTGTGHIDHVAVVTKANSKGSFKLTGMSQYVSEGPSGTMGSVPDGYMLVLMVMPHILKVIVTMKCDSAYILVTTACGWEV